MRNKITYEWVIEIVNEDGDIMEIFHQDTYKMASKLYNDLIDDGNKVKIALVRDVGNEIEGLIDRSWAYITYEGIERVFSYGFSEDGESFDRNGVAVPKRFIKEVN